MITPEVIKEGNDIIAAFDGKLPEYRKSGMFDINNVEIIEGSIINADGYNSILGPDEYYLHIVEFYEGQFTSDVYGDADPIRTYKKIEVVGHVEDYRHIETEELSGVGLCNDCKYNYHLSLDALYPVMNKIRSMYHVRYDISMADMNDDKSADASYNHFGSNYVTLGGYGHTHWSIPKQGERKADNIIEALWAVTARFIMWHNEQEKIKKEQFNQEQ